MKPRGPYWQEEATGLLLPPLRRTPFPTPRERIKQAKAHRIAIGQAWDDFILQPDPYESGVDVRDDGKGSIWVREARELPAALSVELGAMLYQLRAALDACVYQAAILESGQDPPPHERDLEFPLCTKPADFGSSAKKIAPIKQPKLRDYIERVQPYHIPHLRRPGLNGPWLPAALALLNDWARKDRHRRLHVIGGGPIDADPELHCPPGVTISSMKVLDVGLIGKDKTTLAKFRLKNWQPGSDIAVDPNSRISLVSDHPPRESNSDTLDDRTDSMVKAVEGVLLAFEASY